MRIIKEKHLQTVCQLGGFHILMSFLGSMGNLINGSGLEEAFEEFYSGGTIKYILSRHAVARALRAHILAQTVLVHHISNTLTHEGNFRVSGLESFYNIVMENALTKEQTDDINNNDAFINMLNAISNYSKETSKEFRTPKLWLLYIEYIYMPLHFNWYLHPQFLMKMIYLFAASGQRSYAKYSRLYLHETLILSDTN